MQKHTKSPPLNALRAFEAAARLESFTAAALELSVTPGAVAQQIKALELWYGTELFERGAKGVHLSAVGRDVRPKFVEAFDSLSEAIQALQVRAEPNKIRIAALPAIAQLWLSPLLPLLRGQMPELSISITAMDTPPNLERESFDLSIFFLEEVEGETQTIIADDLIYPVCSPDLATEIASTESLEAANLLIDNKWEADWDHWFEACNETPASKLRKSEFSLYSLAVEEAKNGAGVLMGHDLLVRPLLTAGVLTKPFTHDVRLDQKLVVSLAKQSANNANVREIATVLSKQAKPKS
jgi:DNA-binding transcriptional LysR family regulator